jgi:hypothetical protein
MSNTSRFVRIASIMRRIGEYNAWHKLCYRGLGTGLERVRQAALATVLAVLVEGHL